MRDDSATFDETYHLYAGVEYLERGTYFLNMEHPPLTKLLAAAALRPLDLYQQASGGPPPEGQPVDIATYNTWVYRNRAEADAIVAAARRPFRGCSGSSSSRRTSRCGRRQAPRRDSWLPG